MHPVNPFGAWDIEVMSILRSTHVVLLMCTVIHGPATSHIIRGLLFLGMVLVKQSLEKVREGVLHASSATFSENSP